VPVLLADDHGIVRRGLMRFLEEAGLLVVGEAADGLEAVRLCEEHRPDLLIVDIGMPELSGIDVAAWAQKLDRPPGVIILSMHADQSYIIRALAAGARAYLLKDATDEDLLPAVSAVASGRRFFSAAVSAVLVEDYVRPLPNRGLTDSYHLLTDREKEVLHLLAEGRSNKEGLREQPDVVPAGREASRKADGRRPLSRSARRHLRAKSCTREMRPRPWAVHLQVVCQIPTAHANSNRGDCEPVRA
jgi:two-component system response regulator NreC